MTDRCPPSPHRPYRVSSSSTWSTIASVESVRAEEGLHAPGQAQLRAGRRFRVKASSGMGEQ